MVGQLNLVEVLKYRLGQFGIYVEGSLEYLETVRANLNNQTQIKTISQIELADLMATAYWLSSDEDLTRSLFSALYIREVYEYGYLAYQSIYGCNISRELYPSFLAVELLVQCFLGNTPYGNRAFDELWCRLHDRGLIQPNTESTPGVRDQGRELFRNY